MGTRLPIKRGSPSHLGNTACLIVDDILLKRCQEGVSSFQEDKVDGRVPLSPVTRRDGHRPDSGDSISAHRGRDLHAALGAVSWMWVSLRPYPLSVSANGPRCAVWRPQRGAAALCAQVFLPVIL